MKKIWSKIIKKLHFVWRKNHLSTIISSFFFKNNQNNKTARINQNEVLKSLIAFSVNKI